MHAGQDDADALRIEAFFKLIRHEVRELFLHERSREMFFDGPSELAQADGLAMRDVPDIARNLHRLKMMRAEREDLVATENHQIAGSRWKGRPVVLLRSQHLSVEAGNASRRFSEIRVVQ